MAKTTTPTRREIELLDALRRFGGRARNSELASVLDVSEETIRRTIKALSKSGSIARVHGGAYLVGTQSDPSFFRRIAEHSDEKKIIARAVAISVSDGMTVFLDVGSTTAFVTEELRVRHNLTVVTNSIKSAQTLVGHNNNRVFLLGGEMQADEQGAFGFVAERQSKRYIYDIAILSSDALNSKNGFTYQSASEADLASVIIENANVVTVAMAHQKFETAAPHRGFHPGTVDYLVTDAPPENRLASSLAAWSVEVTVSNEKVRREANV